MKRLLLGIGFSLAGLAGAAAADLTMPTKAPALAPAPSWTGMYIGVNAGWLGSVNNTINNTGADTGTAGLGGAVLAGLIPLSTNVSYSGFLGGGQTGYNWQAGNWVFGLESDLDAVSAKGSRVVGPAAAGVFGPVTTTYNREMDWLSTVRARVGFTAGQWFLLYVTGGMAFDESKIATQFLAPALVPNPATQAATANSVTNWGIGWTAGAGAEWMFAPHWSVKAEYLYADLGTESSVLTYTYGTNNSFLTSRVRDTVNVVRGGINYHF